MSVYIKLGLQLLTKTVLTLQWSWTIGIEYGKGIQLLMPSPWWKHSLQFLLWIALGFVSNPEFEDDGRDVEYIDVGTAVPEMGSIWAGISGLGEFWKRKADSKTTLCNNWLNFTLNDITLICTVLISYIVIVSAKRIRKKKK